MKINFFKYKAYFIDTKIIHDFVFFEERSFVYYYMHDLILETIIDNELFKLKIFTKRSL